MMLSELDETDLSPLTAAEFAISQIDDRNREYYESNKEFLDKTLVQEKYMAASAAVDWKMDV